MRTWQILTMTLVVGTSLVVPMSSWGHMLRSTPTQVAISAADSTGLCRVFVKFDISSLAEGVGRRIEDASIDWKVDGVPSDRKSIYDVYVVTGDWRQDALTGEGTPSARPEPESTWEILPFDYQRNGGGLIHLDITHAVSEWAAGKLSNFGICIQSRDVARTALLQQVEAMKLTVLYGFVPVSEEASESQE